MSNPRERLEAWSRVASGHVLGVESLLGELEHTSTPSDRAFATAIRAAWWHAQPDLGERPTLASVPTDEPDADARALWSLACADISRAALLAFELDAAAAAADRALQYAGSAGPLAHAAWTTAALVDVLGDGRVPLAREPDVDAADRFPFATIDRAVMFALAAERRGDLDEATTWARRASRMARTEEMPQREYLANVALARTRRLHGLTHHAVRILTALLRAAPAQWHGWIRYELTAAGGTRPARDDGPPGLAPTWADRIASELESLVRSAESGSRVAFEDARCSLDVDTVPRAIRDDVRLAAQAIDPEVRVDVLDPSLRAFCVGDEPLPPRGLHGVGRGADGSAIAYVVAGAGGARRILGPGRGLLSASTSVLDHGDRVAALLSSLALAGDAGLAEAELFQRVYGFAFRPRLHASSFRVLLHRSRGVAPGTIARAGDRIALEASQPFAVADPRCTHSTDDRVLYVLASRRGLNAREVARQLGIPLRNVQRTLRDLVDQGFCVRERAKNQVAYVVRDTTFSEPTKTDMLRPVSVPPGPND